MTGASGCAVTAASRKEDRAGRDVGGSAADTVFADTVFKALYARGISRQNRRLKHRSTTLTRAFSLEGENAPSRVQALPELGKMRVFRWRGGI